MTEPPGPNEAEIEDNEPTRSYMMQRRRQLPAIIHKPRTRKVSHLLLTIALLSYNSTMNLLLHLPVNLPEQRTGRSILWVMEPVFTI